MAIASEIAILIDTRLAALDAHRPTSFGDHAAWRAYHGAGSTLIEWLVREHGARYRSNGSDGHHLKLAGIACSCTAGELALVRSWTRKARAQG